MGIDVAAYRLAHYLGRYQRPVVRVFKQRQRRDQNYVFSDRVICLRHWVHGNKLELVA